MKRRRPKYPLAHFSPAKDELMVIAITRESVDTGDTAPLLEKLSLLSSSREAALKWEGKLTFYFDGWDQDPRETAEIPEIRTFFRKVTSAWPYWFHFSEKVGDTVMHVLRLLCRGRYVRGNRPGMVGWQFDDPHDVGRQMMRLFTGQNGMYDQFQLPETMNERITQEVTQLLENSLE